ncbi:MAG: Alcohol dehydrogenase catalytic protein [Thermoproteota archaeon]|nr:Alcohol dehydrogenase catalytic protein [Thermoproteota archaeon]
MRGIIFLGEKQLELREFPEPIPSSSEVIVEMHASGLCGSDLRPYRTPKIEAGDPTQLKAAGHEPCGQIKEIGSEVHYLKVGDRVIVHHYLGCGYCKWCLAGYSQLCIDPNAKKLYYGRTNHGGHADRIAVNENACVLMPEHLSYEEGAACACGTGTAYDAIRRLAVSGRDTFAIYGQGPVGLSATLFGVATGARVLVVEPVAYRRELAKSLGCEVAINPLETNPVEAIKELTHGEGADATFDCTGIPEPRNNTIKSARIFGRACFVGEGGQTSFDISRDIIHKQLTIYGSWTMSTIDLAEVSNYVVDHKLPLSRIITHRFPLERADEAYRIFESGQTGKVMIVWP